MNTIIIGIAGGTGSGKTTLTERLRDHFGIDEVSVINHDSYYKRHDELPYEERCKLNYDHPDSFDTPLMVAHLRELRAGHPVQVPVYDYTIHNRSNETVLVRPAPVTRRIRSLPPETVCRAVPSVTRSSAPESTTTVPSFCASAWAQSAASMGTVRLSTPCSAAERPTRAAASP